MACLIRDHAPNVPHFRTAAILPLDSWKGGAGFSLTKELDVAQDNIRDSDSCQLSHSVISKRRESFRVLSMDQYDNPVKVGIIRSIEKTKVA